MKSARALIALALVPLMMARPDDQGSQENTRLSAAARALVRKPRRGRADLTLSDGTVKKGAVLRVNNQFVTVEASVCENIALTKIKEIKWEREVGWGDGYPILLPAWVVPALPVLWTIYAIGSRDPVLGSWVSVDHQAEGLMHRVKFEWGRTRSGHGYIYEQIVHSVRTGHYSLDDDNLRLTPDYHETPQTVAIRFQCTQLVLASPIQERLVSLWEPEDGAHSPLVGRWSTMGSKEPAIWEFRENGIFQIESAPENHGGTYSRTKTGAKIVWSEARQGEEEWQIRVSKGHLFITARGQTIEYEHGTTIR